MCHRLKREREREVSSVSSLAGGSDESRDRLSITAVESVCTAPPVDGITTLVRLQCYTIGLGWEDNTPVTITVKGKLFASGKIEKKTTQIVRDKTDTYQTTNRLAVWRNRLLHNSEFDCLL